MPCIPPNRCAFRMPAVSLTLVDGAADGVTGLNCAGYGSAVVVTAAFGFVAAAYVLRKLAGIAAAPVQASPQAQAHAASGE